MLIARLESVNDPINGEQGNGTPIRDNVLNSNNIVTRNTFLIDPNIGGSPGETWHNRASEHYFGAEQQR
jgi:hypothetical protein